MKTQTTKTKWAGWGTALGLAVLSMTAMTGCLTSGQDGSVSASSATWIAGRAQADDSASFEGAVVTTHEVDATGAVGPAVDNANMEADGTFRVRTKMRGVRFLIIRIAHHGWILKARLEDRIDAGDSLVVGAVNGESTVEAEVRIKLRATEEGRAALSSEVRAAIEAALQDSGLVAFRGDSTARAQLVIRLETAVRAASKARVEAVAELVRRVEAADSARPDSTRPPRPRPELTPCEKAALLIASMNVSDSGFADLRARFEANCLDRDSLPPPPQACHDAKARLEIVGSSSAEGADLRLRLAAHCDSIAPPPTLRPCERAAIRLAAMATTDPAYIVLRARFAAHCMDDDPEDDDEVDAGVVASATALVRADK
jgi:hypothetical protein